MVKSKQIIQFVLLAVMALVLSACDGCSDEVGLERDLFEERDMYPYDFDGEPAIDGPERLLFLDMLTGETKTASARIENVGRTVLYIDDFEVEGPFDLEVPAAFEGAEARLKPGETVDLEVSYTAVDEEPRQGMLTVVSNDPEKSELPIELWANVEIPCMEVEPATSLIFGDIERGFAADRRIYITNCAERSELNVEVADFVDDAGFSLVNEEELPLSIEAGTTQSLNVEFAPQELRPYEGAVTLEGQGAIEEEVTVDLRGVGAPPPCPQAVIEGGSEAESVTAAPTGTLQGYPLETVSFDGSASQDADGNPVAAYEWTLVERPEDTFVDLSQSPTSAMNELYLELAGTYVVELNVWDQEGTKSCEPARMTVESISNDAIHLQLVWDTPTDPDPYDNSGTDVDLHFLHEEGAWNTDPYDCHWLNTNPSWGNDNNTDTDPSLDIDKVDGWGPENINLFIPEDDVTYSAGAFYFSDHGFGESFVTVRIFIHGRLELEITDRRLLDREFWYVADIDWPSETITVVDQITNGFPN